MLRARAGQFRVTDCSIVIGRSRVSLPRFKEVAEVGEAVRPLQLGGTTMDSMVCGWNAGAHRSCGRLPHFSVATPRWVLPIAN